MSMSAKCGHPVQACIGRTWRGLRAGGLSPRLPAHSQGHLLSPRPACRVAYMVCWDTRCKLHVLSDGQCHGQFVGHRWRLACSSMHQAGNSPALMVNSALQFVFVWTDCRPKQPG